MAEETIKSSFSEQQKTLKEKSEEQTEESRKKTMLNEH